MDSDDPFPIRTRLDLFAMHRNQLVAHESCPCRVVASALDRPKSLYHMYKSSHARADVEGARALERGEDESIGEWERGGRN